MPEEHNASSTFKTTISHEEVEAFLQKKYGAKNVSNLTYIKGGEVSQAFSFTKDGQKLIFRVNKHTSSGYKKDLYAYEHVASNIIPIPKILEIGRFDDKHFAISVKVAGDVTSHFSSQHMHNILPEALHVLEAIHAHDISHTKGFGKWDASATAMFGSWKEHILNIEFKRDWEKLFVTTFMEKDLFEKLYAKLITLLEYCPEERYLIHGDYGYDNLLSDGQIITGVIDWTESQYGDFLYDIAWLDYWAPTTGYKDAFVQRAQVQNKENKLENFKERILCYQVYIALSSMSFYAFSNQEEKYKWGKEKVKEFLQ